MKYSLLIAPFVAVLAASIVMQPDLLLSSFNRAVYVVCHGRPFVESIEIAKYIREHSAPSDRIAVLGSEPQIYFYAQRHSITGYIYTYALTEPQPDAPKMQQEMIDQIESGHPEYMVWVGYFNSWLNVVEGDWDPGKFRVANWFNEYAKEHYDRVGVTDTRSDGQVHYLWDDEARNYHGAVGDCLILYRRKPEPK